MRNFQPKVAKAPVRYSSIQVQFEQTPTHSGDAERAVEPPTHDEEVDEETANWLDAAPDEIPSLDSAELETFALLSHSRIKGVLSKAMGEKGKAESTEKHTASKSQATEADVVADDHVFDFSW